MKFDCVSVVTPEDLFQFVMKNENEKGFMCLICKKRCKEAKLARNHVEAVHFPDKFEYKCELCELVLRTWNSYSIHKYRKHNFKQC